MGRENSQSFFGKQGEPALFKMFNFMEKSNYTFVRGHQAPSPDTRKETPSCGVELADGGGGKKGE